MPLLPEDMEKDKKKHRFTILEKLAVVIIVILILVILLLLFNRQIREYFEIIKAWYENA